MRVVASLLISTWLALGLTAGTLVRFHLPIGDMTFELLDDAAPLTTSNFLAQLSSGAYSNTIVDEFLPFSGEYFAHAGTLAITNRGKSNADFTQLASASGPRNESLLDSAYPNVAGTLAMELSGSPAYLTNNTLVLATNSDAIRFVLNLGGNGKLDAYAVKIGTNGINLQVWPPNTNQFDTFTTNCIYITNCITVTNCVITTNCTVTTNRWQKIPGYTPFGLLRIGNDTFNQFRTFTISRQPETNILIPELTLPPPVNGTFNYFPVTELNRTAIEQGTFDFTKVLSLDISVVDRPKVQSTITTNGTIRLSWESWSNLTKVEIYSSTNLPPTGAFASGQFNWQLYTTLTNPVAGMTHVSFLPDGKRRFFQLLFE